MPEATEMVSTRRIRQLSTVELNMSELAETIQEWTKDRRRASRAGDFVSDKVGVVGDKIMISVAKTLRKLPIWAL